MGDLADDAFLRAVASGDADALANLLGGLPMPTVQSSAEPLKDTSKASNSSGPGEPMPSETAAQVTDTTTTEAERATSGEPVEGAPPLDGGIDDPDVDMNAYLEAKAGWDSHFPTLGGRKEDPATLHQQPASGAGSDLGQKLKKDKLVQSFPWVEEEIVSSVLESSGGKLGAAEQILSANFPKPTDWQPPVHVSGGPSGATGQARPHTGGSRVTTGVTDWVATGRSVADMYETYRAEAAELARLRNRCFEQAAAAAKAGNGASARAMSSRGRSYNAEMKEKHQLAADAIFYLRNPQGIASGQLDLHGLHVAEALERLADEFDAAPPRTVVKILTGSGHHSRGIHNAPRLRPAVESFLRKNGYRYEVIADSNKHVGAFRVYL